MSLRPAIFMDRDGTLAHEVGYVNDVSRFRLFPWSVEAVRLVNRSGYAAVMVTNQAGVARGYFPEAAIQEVHAALGAAFADGAARLDGVYYCPHHPQAGQPPYRQDCDCRKPRPGLLTRAASATRPPSAATLLAALPAPPGSTMVWSYRRISTGASRETRSTRP